MDHLSYVWHNISSKQLMLRSLTYTVWDLVAKFDLISRLAFFCCLISLFWGYFCCFCCNYVCFDWFLFWFTIRAVCYCFQFCLYHQIAKIRMLYLLHLKCWMRSNILDYRTLPPILARQSFLFIICGEIALFVLVSSSCVCFIFSRFECCEVYTTTSSKTLLKKKIWKKMGNQLKWIQIKLDM